MSILPDLSGLHVLVTAGPTRERIDPVRYLSNDSSGKQGYAIAEAAARHKARVTLISGPVALPPPPGVEVRYVESAVEMLAAVEAALPVDIALCVAAVADYRPKHPLSHKHKKTAEEEEWVLTLVKNPDILAHLSQREKSRPRLVVGFAAETGELYENARAKLHRKGCDWIIANQITKEEPVFGANHNRVSLVTNEGEEPWPLLSKEEVAERLMQRIINAWA